MHSIPVFVFESKRKLNKNYCFHHLRTTWSEAFSIFKILLQAFLDSYNNLGYSSKIIAIAPICTPPFTSSTSISFGNSPIQPLRLSWRRNVCCGAIERKDGLIKSTESSKRMDRTFIRSVGKRRGWDGKKVPVSGPVCWCWSSLSLTELLRGDNRDHMACVHSTVQFQASRAACPIQQYVACPAGKDIWLSSLWLHCDRNQESEGWIKGARHCTYFKARDSFTGQHNKGRIPTEYLGWPNIFSIYITIAHFLQNPQSS